MAPRKSVADRAAEESVENEDTEAERPLHEVQADAPLPGTPVDFGVYETPVGVETLDPGDVVARRQAEVADATEGSKRPEDGYVGE